MSYMIGIIDYGAGNLRSLENALTFLGVEHERISKKLKTGDVIPDKLIIPGVGSFRTGMEAIQQRGLDGLIASWHRPLLGICLGMQLLAETGVEGGQTKGFGKVKGTVLSLPEPHVCWDTFEGKDYYFVHHYATYSVPADGGAMTLLPWAIKQGNLWACQFHPEKSQEAGLDFLRSWLQS